MLNKFLYSLTFIGLTTASAQQVDFVKCATTHAVDYQDELTPGYKELVNTAFDYAKQWSSENGRPKTDYTIPVVVHVVYNTPEQNLHDSVVFNQISNLNKDFNRLSDDAGNLRPIFDPIVGASGIHFELATVDPDGNPTTGIVRRQTDLATFGSIFALLNLAELERVKSFADGGSDPWNQDEYLNIWVCDMSFELLGQTTTALLGYATPPDGLDNWPAGATDGLSDGVVIQYQCFGSNNPNELPSPDGSGGVMEVLGRTVTHEVGHYLGLRHIWGDGDCSEEDGIDDTPNAAAQSQFDCDPTKNTCVDNIPEVGGDAPDMIENFMDYSAESCQNAFTLGQIALMVGVLENFRPNLGDGNPLALQENEIVFDVYPNPFTDEFNLKIEQGSVDEFFLYTLEGKLVLNGSVEANQKIIATSDLNSGLYLLQVSNLGQIKSTTKLIKH